MQPARGMHDAWSRARGVPLPTIALALALACTRAGAPPRLVWGPAVEVASGPAVRGPWQMNASDYQWVDDPAVAIAANGDALVAWVDQRAKDLFFQRYDAAGRARLASAANVSRSAETFSWMPRVVADAADPERAYVLWQEIVFSGGTHGGEIFFARTTDGGRTFSDPANLSASKAGDGKGRLDEKTWDNGSLALASAPDGALHAAWTEYEGALWLRRSTDGGATWTDPTRVAGTPSLPARAPSIAASTGSVVWAAWAVGEDPRSDVHVTRSIDGGRSFGPPATVGDAGGHSDAPHIAIDRDGTVHLVWIERPGGRGSPASELRHARAPRAAADAPVTFERPSTLASSASSPGIAADAEGRVCVLWERVRADGARVGLGLRCSTDGGVRFAASGEVPEVGGAGLGVNGSQQGMLAEKLATTAAGGLVVVNSTFDAGRASRVRLVRGRLER